MKIKLDENLSRHLKAPLLGLGHEVSSALEESLLGKPDDTEVGTAAKSEDRMIFTLDLDFADLRKFPLTRILKSSCLGREAWDLSG